MSKKQIAIIILIISFCIMGLVGGWFYYSRVLTVNYLIPGVPYNGINNLFFSRANTSEISSILDILGYWGDKRFAVSDLGQKFPPDEKPTSTSATLKSEIQSFFTENGYKTSGWFPTEPDNVTKEIKKFVNSIKRVPVIVLTRRTLDEKNNMFLFNFQVVIGVSDNSQKVIVHDHYYGNNYEIPYGDFSKVFQETDTGILAVWPSDKIKGQIKEPNYELVYPQRLESMDKAGTLLATKYLLALRLWREDVFEQSIAVWKEFFDDPNFKYFPSAFQIVQLNNFARLYLYLNQPDEAIKIINEQVLPLNKNLSQTYQKGWSVSIFDELPSPYYILSLAYLKEGNRDLAINSYKELVRIRDLTIEKIGNESNIFIPLRIEELEKEISSKK